MTIRLSQKKGTYQPYDSVNGTIASFSSDKHLKLRLVWKTQGRGQSCSKVVEAKKIDHFSDGRFTFELPEGPYSFCGAFIALFWAVELIHKKELIDQAKFMVSPTGSRYELPHILLAESDAEMASKAAMYKRFPKVKEAFESMLADDDQ